MFELAGVHTDADSLRPHLQVSIGVGSVIDTASLQNNYPYLTPLIPEMHCYASIDRNLDQDAHDPIQPLEYFEAD